MNNIIELEISDKIYFYLNNLVIEELYGNTIQEVISTLLNREIEKLISNGILKKKNPPVPPIPTPSDGTPRSRPGIF